MKALRLAMCVFPLLALAGCERAMHDMYHQPKDGSGKASSLFADGSAQRHAPVGAVAYSQAEAADTSGGRRGRVTEPRYHAELAVPIDEKGASRVQGRAARRRAQSAGDHAGAACAWAATLRDLLRGLPRARWPR